MGTNNLSLAVGEYSPIVDLANYKELLLSIETHGAGTISIEATPFRTDPYWTNQGDIVGWKEIQRTKFLHAEQKDILISKTHCFNRLFRVKNVGSNPIEIKHLMFIGQR
jgi:hypothetical protein